MEHFISSLILVVTYLLHPLGRDFGMLWQFPWIRNKGRISSKLESKEKSPGLGLGFWNILFHSVIKSWKVNDGAHLIMDDLGV